HFDLLGEEKFPVFVAIPIRGKSGALGALVAQRAAEAFTDRDVELLCVLGALIAAGIRHAELIDARRERAGDRRAGGGTRNVTLPGTPLFPGRALGALAALRRPAQRPSERGLTPRDTHEAEVRLLRGAFDVAEKAIKATYGRAQKLALGPEAAFLSTYVEILG